MAFQYIPLPPLMTNDGVVTPPLGRLSVLLSTIGFVAVPATAGQVIVAVPLVEPDPVITQDVVPVTPHARLENDPAARAVPPIAGGEAR